MTLKEKFKEKILSFLGDNMKEQNAIECEKIADDYAIEFAEWLLINTYMQGTISYKTCMLSSQGKDITTKQLLEIFKKEKGL